MSWEKTTDKKRQLTFATEMELGLNNLPVRKLVNNWLLEQPRCSLSTAPCSDCTGSADPSAQTPQAVQKGLQGQGKAGAAQEIWSSGLTCLDPLAQHLCPALVAQGRAGPPGTAAGTSGVPGKGHGALQQQPREQKPLKSQPE